MQSYVTVPRKPTPEILEALRTGSKRDYPSDELCRVRYAALLAAAPAAPAVNERLLEALRGLLADTQHAEHECGDENCPVAAARAALREAEQPQSVRMPTSADEAELMAKLGLMWLEQNAPDRLAEQAVDTVTVSRELLAAALTHVEQARIPQGGRNVTAEKLRALLDGQTVAAQPQCWCETCRPITMDDMRMVLCPTCGNKRCPHATDHRNACTNSNKPGQKGSSWEHIKPAAVAAQEPVQPVAYANAMHLALLDDRRNGFAGRPDHLYARADSNENYNVALYRRPPITQQQIDELIGLATNYADAWGKHRVINNELTLDRQYEARAAFIARLTEVCRG